LISFAIDAAGDRTGGDAARHAGTIEAGGNDRHADLIRHVRVDHGAEDHVHIRVCGLADERSRPG